MMLAFAVWGKRRLSNPQQIRAFLRGSEISVVFHGHKGEHAYFDHNYGPALQCGQSTQFAKHVLSLKHERLTDL
jgi:hypothetical protein